MRIALLALLCCFTAWAQDAVTLPAKANFHLYLLVGQSNMAGRGKVEAQDKVPHARVLMLTKEGTWVPAVDPMHFDKSAAGVGPGRTFGIALAEADPNVTIGLIPCACGGSPISVWEPGVDFAQTHSKPWDDAIRRSELAMTVGTLKGILWHQGESDCGPKTAPLYEAKLTDLIARFRVALGAPDVPFLIGQIGQFEGKPWNVYHKQVDAAQQAVAAAVPHCAYVSSEGLTSNPDKLHFNAESQREFGKRYAAAYLKLVGAARP